MEIAENLGRSNPYYLYAAAARKLPPASLGGDKLNRSLVKRIKIGDKRAESELVLRNFPLVIKIVARHIKQHIPDAVDSGFIGLIDAAKRFNLRRKNTFMTFAQFRIRAAIRNEKRNWKHIVTSGHIDQLQYIFKKLIDGFSLNNNRAPTHEEAVSLLTAYKLAKNLKREPTEEEIKKASGCYDEQVYSLEELIKKPVYLDEPVEHGSAPAQMKTKMSFIPDEKATNALDILMAREERRSHLALLQKLRSDSKSWKPLDRMILEKRWLLPKDECWTLEQVGRSVSLSRERSRAREKDLLNILVKKYHVSAEVLTNLPAVIEALAELAEV